MRTSSASCSVGTSPRLRQVASPLGHWLDRRPARPAICLMSDGGTGPLPPRAPSAFCMVENTTRRMLKFRPIPIASLAISTCAGGRGQGVLKLRPMPMASLAISTWVHGGMEVQGGGLRPVPMASLAMST